MRACIRVASRIAAKGMRLGAVHPSIMSESRDERETVRAPAGPVLETECVSVVRALHAFIGAGHSPMGIGRDDQKSAKVSLPIAVHNGKVSK